MAELNDVIESLFTFCGEAPDELLVSSYRTAARRFLTETRAWREVVTATAVSTAVYTLNVPVDAEAFDFTQHETAEHKLLKMTHEQIANRAFSHTGTPLAVRIGDINQLIVAPDPLVDISSSLVVRAVLRPTLTAESIPDDLIDRYSEVFEYGALERVFRVPGQEWTDFSASAFYAGLFREHTDIESARAADGNMRGIKRTVRYGGY